MGWPQSLTPSASVVPSAAATPKDRSYGRSMSTRPTTTAATPTAAPAIAARLRTRSGCPISSDDRQFGARRSTSGKGDGQGDYEKHQSADEKRDAARPAPATSGARRQVAGPKP